jgi:hypothetical protein
MQVEIEVTSKTKAMVEVEFPLFVKYGDSFDSGGGYDCYSRVDESRTMHTIHQDWNGDWQYEVKQIGREWLGQMVSKDYARSGYSYEKIPAAEFYEKVAELRDKLGAIPGFEK